MQVSQSKELRSHNHLDNHRDQTNRLITPTSTTWSQWGKAAVVFTLATGAYAISKVVGINWRSHTNPTLPLDNIENKVTLEHQHLEEVVLTVNPLITISTLALTAPRNPLISLSAFGLSWLQQIQLTEAVFPATLDLASLTDSEGFVLQGAAADDQTGWSVSSAGDVNGDGLADVLVGAYLATPLGRTNAGVAYILFGSNSSWPAVVDLGNLTSSQGVVLQGAAAGDWTGYSASSAGDVNGDGRSDVLVGAYQANPLGRTEAGVAYLLFGSNGSWPALVDLGNLTPSQGVVLQGAAANDWTGRSVSCAGDVNGDGLSDVLVGAYGADPLGRADAGVAYLLFGVNGSWSALVDLGSLTSSQGVVLQGAAAGDETGFSVSSAGDVNGDGLADMLVGADWADPLGRNLGGVAYLLFGVNGSWLALVDLARLTPSQGVVLQGAAADDRTGRSVSGAGDVNGDGLADMLMGAHLANPLGRSWAGVAYLLFGSNGSWPATLDLGSLMPSQGVVLQGAAADDETGISVSSAGDVNGDGLADVLLGAYRVDPLGRNLAGVAYLLFGTNGSWPAVVDLGSLTLSQGVVLQGAAAGDNTGISISTASDVNGDGLADVLVGARFADPLGRNDAGVAYVILGQTNISSNPTQPSLTDTNTSTTQTLIQTPSPSTSVAISTTATIPATSAEVTVTGSAPTTLTATQLSGSTRALTQNSPGFSIYSNSVLYLAIDVETLITTDNLSVEGFTGDPSQLVFRIPESPNYEVTVNGVEQYIFNWGDVGADFVSIRLGDGACFEDFNDIPMQASDGSTTADFNLVFQANTASCGYSGASTLNAKSALQSAVMLLVSSSLGIFASRRREKTNDKKNRVKFIKKSK